jgi:histone H3/H4
MEVQKMSLIVKAKLKEHSGGLNVAGDLAEALDKKVAHILVEAVERAKANGRKTVQARDL